MKASEAVKLVVLLQGAYPGTAITGPSGRVYEKFLIDLDADTAASAVERLIKTSRFLPTIAEIRGMTADVERGPMRSAEEAWGDVVNEIRRVGAYGAPRFEDPLVVYAVERLGFRNLCLSENDASDRARFCDLYGAARERRRQDEASGHELAPRHAPSLPAPVLKLLVNVGKPAKPAETKGGAGA